MRRDPGLGCTDFKNPLPRPALPVPHALREAPPIAWALSLVVRLGRAQHWGTLATPRLATTGRNSARLLGLLWLAPACPLASLSPAFGHQPDRQAAFRQLREG